MNFGQNFARLEDTEKMKEKQRWRRGREKGDKNQIESHDRNRGRTSRKGINLNSQKRGGIPVFMELNNYYIFSKLGLISDKY